jgi:hypothetical protein
VADSALIDPARRAARAHPFEAIRRLPGAPVLCLVAAIAASGAYLLILQSDFTFYADDWRFILDRRGFSVGVFFNPHNDHIALAPVAVYKALLALFGMTSLLPFAVTSTLVFMLSVVLLFVYVRRRVGDWPALLGCVLVLFLGAAWSDLLWSFQIGFFGSVAAGIGALLALDRDDPKGDLAACALLVVACSFSEVGIPFAIGALVNVALGPSPRRRRLYVPLLPFALYGLWYLGWGHTGPQAASFHHFVNSPGFVFDSISENLASLLGVSPLFSSPRSANLSGLGWARALLVIAIGVVVWRLWRGSRPNRWLWTVLAAGGAFWFLTALNAALLLRTSTSVRYQYPGAVFVLLIAAELLRGTRIDKRALIPAAAVTIAAAASGIVFLHDAAEFRREASDGLRAKLGAVEIGRGHENPNTLILFQLYVPGSVGRYLSAVDEFGSPAFSEARLVASDEADRAAADKQLVAMEGINLTSAGPGLTPGNQAAGRCRAVSGSASASTIALGPGRYTLTVQRLKGIASPVSLPIPAARFADQLTADIGFMEPGRASTLTIPPDRSSLQWRLYWPPGSPGTVCRVSV